MRRENETSMGGWLVVWLVVFKGSPILDQNRNEVGSLPVK